MEVCDQNNHCYRNPITPQTAISDSELRNNFLGQNFALNIGIDGLAGGGFTQLAMKNNNHQPITPSNTSTLDVWTKTLIPPTQNSSNLTLYCYHNCPLYNAGNSQWEMKYPVWDNSGTPYNYLTYTFDRLASNSTYRLLDPNNTPYIASNQESFWLGDLVTTPVANINDLYNGNTSLRYTWRSSQNPWDQFITFKSNVDNSISTFDPPLNLTYQDGNGQRFVQYEGFGQLHGIPGKCYSRVDHSLVSCSSGQYTIWIPEYNIPTGTELTAAGNNTLSYFVKQLNIAQNLLPLSNGVEKTQCVNQLQSSITQASALSLPALNQWSDPNLGTMPSVSNITEVIAGVNQ